MNEFLERVSSLAQEDPALSRLYLMLSNQNFELILRVHLLALEQEVNTLLRTLDERKRKRRKHWVRPYLRRRQQLGHYHALMRELAGENPELYANFMRIDEELFNEIVEKVRPYLQRQTVVRAPLEVGLRVAITLRFLATGDSYHSLGYAFRVAHNTISILVPETCRAIVRSFGEVVKLPTTPEEWKAVAHSFEEKWNFPHAIGAIDGKHVRIKNPALAGSMYFNYKKFYSMVLLALVDANYNFMYADIGACGSESDGGVFAHTRLKYLFEHMGANLPPPEALSADPAGRPVGYFMLGDEAFGLAPWMLRPYPSRGFTRAERIFNYRQSRARRVVENAFGILANR